MIKYFLYIIIFIAFCIPTIGVYFYIHRLKKHAIWKQHFSTFFSNWEKKYCANKLITPALKEIFSILNKKHPSLITSLHKGHFNKVQKHLKKHKREDLSLAIDVMFGHQDLETYLEKHSTHRYKQAWKYYLDSQQALNSGDLDPASVWIQKSIILFAKEKAHYEQGQALILFGIICKISSMFDISFFIYEDAKKIYQSLDLKGPLADVYGHFGSLSILQQQFDNAWKYFEDAKKINTEIKRQNGIAEIYNQMSLLSLHQEKYIQSLSLASQAKEIHTKNKCKNGEAFSFELIARVKMAQKKYISALKNFNSSQELYKQCKNICGYMEVSFSAAQTLFHQQKMDKCEESLRKLLKQFSKNPCNFHIANVYNLLGLIYIHRQDWQRAKGLFEQSLNLELRDDRLKAIACDYANIALMERKLGHIEEEKLQIKNAIAYAQNCGDNELIQKISNMFNVEKASASTNCDYLE